MLKKTLLGDMLILMENLIVMDHPLIQHKLSILRDKNTTVRDFRALSTEITMLMAFEAMRDLPLEDAEVDLFSRQA